MNRLLTHFLKICLFRQARIIFAAVFLLSSIAALSQSSGQKNSNAILDFEADVIEGDKKRPDLFVQLKTEDQDSESIVYLRKNFNDFAISDTKSRPKPIPNYKLYFSELAE